MSDSANTPSRPTPGLWHLWLAAGAVFVLGLALWGSALVLTFDQQSPHSLLTALGTAGLTLAFGGVVGGFLTQLFKVLDSRRTSLAAEQAFYRSVLDDLKGVYDRVERAKLLIEAHKSAKTYGEQMRILPDADITLHNIRRALRPGFADLEDEIAGALKECTKFIKSLTEEFRDKYKDISIEQSWDEAINAHQRTRLSKGEITRNDLVATNEAWKMVEKLEALEVLRDNSRYDEYYVNFRWHIDLASFHLRSRLEGGANEELPQKLFELEKKLTEANERIRTKKQKAETL